MYNLQGVVLRGGRGGGRDVYNLQDVALGVGGKGGGEQSCILITFKALHLGEGG